MDRLMVGLNFRERSVSEPKRPSRQLLDKVHVKRERQLGNKHGHHGSHLAIANGHDKKREWDLFNFKRLWSKWGFKMKRDKGVSLKQGISVPQLNVTLVDKLGMSPDYRHRAMR